jgi:hypothetical protein
MSRTETTNKSRNTNPKFYAIPPRTSDIYGVKLELDRVIGFIKRHLDRFRYLMLTFNFQIPHFIASYPVTSIGMLGRF